jgi:hypothetical protein
MDSRKASDVFWATFMGEYIEIILKSEPGESGRLLIRGYLLDYDDDYYYLGAGPLEITGAIKKEPIAVVNITKEIDPAMEVLQNSPDPLKDEDIN